jgi:SAM-dependent methyltransferase
MAIEILTGMPGSGKTSRVIDQVKLLRQKKQLVFLFVPRTPFTELTIPLTLYGSISSRSGDVLPVDHFTSPSHTFNLLQNFFKSAPATLFFDEAQHYGTEFVPLWVSLSDVGHTLVISTPSQPQIDALSTVSYHTTKLGLSCNLLSDGEATQFFVVPDRHTTLAVCDNCATQLQSLALQSIRNRLIENEPYPNQPVIYQPIACSDRLLSGLENLRPDSSTRSKIMSSVLSKYLGDVPYRQMTYLDLGCNTGFFCEMMSQFGFVSTGVDVVENDITIAKVLDSWIYRSFIEFICQDAMTWLLEDHRVFDVVSSFSVFQWLYVQRPAHEVDAVLQRFLRKVGRILFFEMGYGVESHYSDTPAAIIDRDWVMQLLNKSVLFKELIVIPAGEQGLKRDFFVAVRSGS